MTEQRLSKAAHAKLSRLVCMLFNRAMMYTAEHPHIKEAVNNLHEELTVLLPNISMLSLIMNQGKLHIDDEPVDVRINTNRIVNLFKKLGLQSITFSAGIGADELETFIDIFTSQNQYSDSEAMSEALDSRGVENLKINHVFYKKITRDDEIVARSDTKAAGDAVAWERNTQFQKQFMEKLLESVLTEEAGQSLSMKNLMTNPTGLSRRMLMAEKESQQALETGGYPGSGLDEGGSEGSGTGGIAGEGQEITPGSALFYQVQALTEDVQKSLEEDSQVDMMEVADAVFEMKRQLVMGIESQKALNVAYANEENILDQVNELTDNVLLKLIKDEYRQGEITTSRLAQILRRLAPEAGELKRLLPKIKATLLAEGMPLAEYLELVRHLGKELENEGLARILQEAAESVGVDGEELIAEIRKNPEQAAELMTIAAEIHKGAGNEKEFTEILVNYVEQLGGRIYGEAAGENSEGEAHARQIINNLGSGLASQLKSMNFSHDALIAMEERINARIEKIFEKQAGDWVPPSSPVPSASPRPERSLLQLMERSRGNDEELRHILAALRQEADAGELDENSFEQIYAGIARQEALLREAERKKEMPPGVLRSAELKLYLEKELFRAKRHDLCLSTLAFTIVNVRPQEKVPVNIKIKRSQLFQAAYWRLLDIVRTSDIIGELKQDTMTVILPMATKADAELALKRITKLLHEEPFEVEGIPLNVIIAGSVTAFRPSERPNIEAYLKTMVYNLDHVAVRVKNIHNI